MMKKILSLCLAVIMLLGMIAMGVSAEETEPTEPTVPAFKEWKLVLNDGIDIKFVFEGLDADTEYTVMMESEAGDLEVKATADTNGLVTATYPMLNPTMFDVKVTATLVELDLTRANVSIMEYCNNVIGSMEYSDQLRGVVIDLLNYAAATELYVDNDAVAPAVSPFGRELTAEEEAAIKTMTETVKTKQFEFPTLALLAHIFAKIGVTYNKIPDAAISSFHGVFFTESGLVNGADIQDAYKQTYGMIVPNSWSGAKFDEDNQNILDADDFKIGDVFVVNVTTKPNWLFLYVGDNQFLAWNNSSRNYRGTITMENMQKFLAGQGYSGLKFDGTTAVNIATGAMNYCYILRASRLLPNDQVIAPEVSDIVSLGTPYNNYDILAQLEATPNQDAFAVKFDSAMPILGQSVGYRFYVSGALDGVTFYGKLADGAELPMVLHENETRKYVDFVSLTPADLSKVVTVVAKDAEGNVVSIEKQFSGESYASWALDGDNAKLKYLVFAMMRYSQGVQTYVTVGNDFNGVARDNRVHITDVTNWAAVQYRISLIEQSDITFKCGAQPMMNGVYQGICDINVDSYLNGASSNSKVEDATEDATNLYSVARVEIDLNKKILEQVQIGDIIVTSESLKDGAVIPEKYGTLPTGNTNYLYIGNGKFIRGTNGNANGTIVDMKDFDDPNTDAKEEIFDLYNYTSRFFIVRPSNLIGYPVPDAE